MATKEEILDAIAEMSVLELSELLKDFEEKFGVTAAAPVAVAAAASGERRQWRGGGAGLLRCRPDRRWRQEDPGHQGGPCAYEPRAEGCQGPCGTVPPTPFWRVPPRRTPRRPKRPLRPRALRSSLSSPVGGVAVDRYVIPGANPGDHVVFGLPEGDWCCGPYTIGFPDARLRIAVR